ncbi:MAG: hypothetical protein ABSG62_16735 [Terracidiphilus sp.]|jgi:hypothetical protein
MMEVPIDKREPSVGLIGLCRRGASLLENLLGANAQIVAVCDIIDEHAEHAASGPTKQPNKDSSWDLRYIRFSCSLLCTNFRDRTPGSKIIVKPRLGGQHQRYDRAA